MEKIKKLKLGEFSTTGQGVDDFHTMPKKEQISYLSERLSPSGDTRRAEILLKGVKNGDNISKAGVGEVQSDNATNVAGTGEAESAARPRNTKG